MNGLSWFRRILYSIALVWALLALALSAALLGSTITDFNGYDGVEIIMIVVSGLGLISLVVFPFILFILKPDHALSSTLSELLLLILLWALYLVGGALLTGAPDFSALSDVCILTTDCNIADALKAFTWLGFATLTILITLVVIVWIRGVVLGREGVWKKAFDGTWADEKRQVLGEGEDGERVPITLPVSTRDSR